MSRRHAIRWALMLACWLGAVIVALVARTGEGLWWFAGGLVVASVVPRVWRWSATEDGYEGVGE